MRFHSCHSLQTLFSLGALLFWDQICWVCSEHLDFQRRTKHTAAEQKLHSWTHTPPRRWGSCNTLAEVAISTVRGKKKTKTYWTCKTWRTGRKLLIRRENIGFRTDLGEIMRLISILVGCFPIPSATERGLSQHQIVKKDEGRTPRWQYAWCPGKPWWRTLSGIRTDQ